MAKAMSSCARSSTDRAPGSTSWRYTPERQREANRHEARPLPSHRSGFDVDSRGVAHHRWSLWRPRTGASYRCRNRDEDESVSAGGKHAELLGSISRLRVGNHDIPYG